MVHILLFHASFLLICFTNYANCMILDLISSISSSDNSEKNTDISSNEIFPFYNMRIAFSFTLSCAASFLISSINLHIVATPFSSCLKYLAFLQVFHNSYRPDRYMKSRALIFQLRHLPDIFRSHIERPPLFFCSV